MVASFRSGGSDGSSMAEVKQDMLPDSTQGETPDQKKGTKRKGSKDGKKKKKVAKRKSKVTGKSKTKSSPGSDVDSDLDLSKEKQPLEFYLHDREELINEAFKAVSGLQLTNMVPDILKYVPLDELKRLCLNQLEGLSRKRIRHIIQGTEMLSSSDSDESAPEDEVGAVTVTTASVQAEVTVNAAEEKKDIAEMETCADSTITPVTHPHPDSQKAEVESKVEDIDGVPVEVDVNIEELAFGKAGAQLGSRAVKTSSGDAVSAAKPSKDTSKTKNKGSTEKHSQVSSTHHRSRSRSPRRRRSWSSRSHSRERYSRSRSRSRRRSWSRSRSRSRSWSRSWSRSRSRSRTRSRSPGRKEPLPVDPPMPLSPPPSPPHVDAIQMRYPTPPTPTGSLSSGEIREILELESEEEEEEEEEEAVEDRRCREQEMRRKLEGLVGGRKGLEPDKVSGKMTCVSMTGKLEDAAAPPCVDDGEKVVQPQSGPMESISSVSQSCEDVAAGNEEAVSMETSKRAGTYPDKMSCEDDEEDDDEEEDDSDDGENDSDDSDDDSEEDDDEDDINLDSLDLGVDMSKAAGQPSQLALARASIKSPSTSNASSSNATEEKKDSGEAELEVLELELRARAIRSLMHKCLKEDDKT